MLPYQKPEPCTFPNCKGIKVTEGSGWICTFGGHYHYLWVRAQLIREAQKRFYALPLESFKDETVRYFENLRRNVRQEVIKDVPQGSLL